jgi:hypothetical protein
MRFLFSLDDPESRSTLEDMALVEAVDGLGRLEPRVGQNWLYAQTQRPTGFNVLSALLARSAGHLNAYHCAVIYGSGGWNRWQLREDGRVCFSGGHGSKEAAEAANDLGFDVI